MDVPSVAWDESTLTYNTRPAGAANPTFGSVTMSDADAWYSLNASSYVSGNGLYTIGLTSGPSDPVGRLYAKEQSNGGSVAYLEVITENSEAYNEFDYWMYTHGVKYPDWDDDGDGVLNQDEFLGGSIPTDSSSFFTKEVSENTLGHTKITFDSITDRLYTIQWNSDLNTTWTDFTGAVDIVGTGSQIEFTDSDTPPKRFYHVKVKMAP